MAKKAAAPAGRVAGLKAPTRKPDSKNEAASRKLKLPGVNRDVVLTRGVTEESALEHQRKQAIKRAELAGAPIGTRIKVRALKTGYTNETRYREGDVFHVNAEDFSARWMERIDKGKVSKPTGPNEAIAREHDKILGGKVKRDPKGPADDDDSDDE